MVNSCGECANCLRGDEQYCLDGMVPTYAGTDRDGTTTQGGYSTHVVVDADYVLRVPDGIDPRPPRRCSAPASPPTPRCAAGAPVRASASPSSASAASATWPSRSRPRWAPR